MTATSDRIAAAFAEAVAAGHLDEAEGWFSVARLNAAREGEVSPVRLPEYADRALGRRG